MTLADEIANYYKPGGNANPHPELHLQVKLDTPYCGNDVETCADCALGIILVSTGVIELRTVQIDH